MSFHTGLGILRCSGAQVVILQETRPTRTQGRHGVRPALTSEFDGAWVKLVCGHQERLVAAGGEHGNCPEAWLKPPCCLTRSKLQQAVQTSAESDSLVHEEVRMGEAEVLCCHVAECSAKSLPVRELYRTRFTYIHGWIHHETERYDKYMCT